MNADEHATGERTEPSRAHLSRLQLLADVVVFQGKLVVALRRGAIGQGLQVQAHRMETGKRECDCSGLPARAEARRARQAVAG